MGLSTRIQKLEVVAAPIKAEQERRREAAEFREMILAHLKDHIEDALSLSRYVHGDTLDEEEAIKDIVELSLLYHTQATDRFGTDEGSFYKATSEQLIEVNRDVARRINREYFGQHQTAEQYDETEERWKQARADRAAGVDSAESEAAEYLRQLFKRYPRKQGVKRYYDLWD
jgi:hypothetical protein